MWNLLRKKKIEGKTQDKEKRKTFMQNKGEKYKRYEKIEEENNLEREQRNFREGLKRIEREERRFQREKEIDFREGII